jgi:hypothetical protein
MKLETINTSRLTWCVMRGDEHDDYVVAYCADGDGMVQLVDYGDRVELQDQLSVVNTFRPARSHDDVVVMLEVAQKYLAATYNDLFHDIAF